MRKFCKQEHYKDNRVVNGFRETKSFAPKQYFVLDQRTRETIIPGTVTRTQANRIVALLNSYEKELAECQSTAHGI